MIESTWNTALKPSVEVIVPEIMDPMVIDEPTPIQYKAKLLPREFVLISPTKAIIAGNVNDPPIA